MKRLIANQTIRIDSHRLGELNWDDPSQDIHLHKKSNNNSKRRYEIRISLNTHQDQINVIDEGDQMSEVPKRIQNEVQKSLSDQNKRATFISDLREAISACGCSESQMVDVAEKIEKAFGLTEGTLKGCFCKDNCCVRLKQLDEVHYQTVVNTLTNEIYIGQFSPGDMNGIHSDSQERWISTLISHLEQIFNCASELELQGKLNKYSADISGIGQKTRSDSCELFRELYNI